MLPPAREEEAKPESVAKQPKADVLEETEFHPEGKDESEFRKHYDTANPRFELVKKTYELMHVNQTVEFVQERNAYYGKFDKRKLGVMDALFELNKLIDDSDPDVDVPNSAHAFQTAERIREKHPNDDWFHLVGLIHDVGKVMALWGEPQWATVGDTYPVGCQSGPSILFREQFDKCKDSKDERYNTKLGMYKEGCGLEKVMMSWGHDEYMYQVLAHNKTTLPDEGLYMIRYHSFYPWHQGGDYDYLCNEKDRKMLPWVKEFNQFDLYSKCDAAPDVDSLVPYYQKLIDKYCPGLLEW